MVACTRTQWTSRRVGQKEVEAVLLWMRAGVVAVREVEERLRLGERGLLVQETDAHVLHDRLAACHGKRQGDEPRDYRATHVRHPRS